ncbi:MAG TPA: isochorismatase family protein, partial [Chromatiales bacterium]|nr:isochorismatase family protein [Chromatiales bacterium]
QYPQGLGHTIDPIRDQLPEDISPLQKTSFSTCSASGFEQRLTHDEERNQLIIVGIEAHICVLQTASGLQHWGYQVFVAADGVCSRTPANRDNGLARMRHSGIQITNAESVAFEWMGDATHEKFKEVAKLFK